jgi:SpoVK/Ycf46/Vps4 family AAA+-type ATPase
MSEIVYEREEKYAKEEVVDNSGASVEIFEKFVEAVSKNDNKTSSNSVMNSSSKYFSKKNNDELTLSFILNVLDGVQETPGRIMIMTSNYIQKIDKALIRPGRFDICLELGYVIMDTVKEFYHFHYNKNISKAMEHTLNIEKLTPAELVSMRRSSNDAKLFIQQLQQRTPRV